MRTTATLFFLATAGLAAATTCANCPATIISGSKTFTLSKQAQDAESLPRVCQYANPAALTVCTYKSDGTFAGSIGGNVNGECPQTTTTYTNSSCITY